jgi:hypothetical protein
MPSGQAFITIFGDYDSPCICGLKRRFIWVEGREAGGEWYHLGNFTGSLALACVQEGA